MNEQTDRFDWREHWALSSRLGLERDRVSVEAYTSPDIFAQECEKIFGKTWIPVAREDEIPEPGDFIKRDIYPLQAEAIIARDKEGALHAFHNSCRHRGSALVTECKGRTSRFVCPYHAWSYGLDGTLRGVLGKAYFAQVEIGDTRLKPIHLATWNGFVFLNFDDEPRQTLREYLGELGTLLDALPLDDFKHVIEFTWDIDTNWKTLMEASNEAYHVAALHKATLDEQLTTQANPCNNSYDAFLSPPHATNTVQANVAWRPNKPVQQFVYAGEAFRAQPGGPSARGFAEHPGINRIGLPSMSTESIVLFPFTCIQVLAQRYIWFQYWPVAVDKTRFVLRVYLHAPPSSYREAFAEAHMAAYTRDIASEDAFMTTTQYRGFRSGGVSEVVFGENEPILRFFHEMVAQHLAR